MTSWEVQLLVLALTLLVDKWDRLHGAKPEQTFEGYGAVVKYLCCQLSPARSAPGCCEGVIQPKLQGCIRDDF